MKHTLRTLALFSLFSPFLLFSASPEEMSAECHQIYSQLPTIYLPVTSHTLFSVSAYGDTLELEDGSLWTVGVSDGRNAMQWRTDEPLSITQNTRWFSSYNYRIVNRSRNVYMEANLSPLTNSALTYYVTDFDFTRGLVTLANSNQSVRWEIHPYDLYKFQSWDFTQPIPVILGDNNDYDGSSTYKWEGILINVRQAAYYLRAHQF